MDTCLARVSVRVGADPSGLRRQVGDAFQKVPLATARVVILGQGTIPIRPRATPWVSVSPAGRMGRSHRRGGSIYEERSEPAATSPLHTRDISARSRQGVMLLNRALTVPADPQVRPKRHLRWWAPIVTSAAKAIALEAADRPIAALLWGVPAQKVRPHLEPNVEVFAASHPSPLSASRPAGVAEPFRGIDTVRQGE